MSVARPVACSGHAVEGVDVHLVVLAPPAPPTPVPVGLPFKGKVVASSPVVVNGRAVALHQDVAIGEPHQPPPGTSFVPQFMTHTGVLMASQSVVIAAGRAVVAKGDLVASCHFGGPTPTSMVTEGDPSLVVP